jgi:hypothetical protein
MNPPPLRFTIEQAHAAADEWGFNCGPAALCAALELTPDEVRPHLDGFDRKRYTNPTMMWDALRRLGVDWGKFVLGSKPRHSSRFPSLGLARVQWSGPWCDPGRPPQAAYRHTHWVAACGSSDPVAIFDVNNPGSWVSLDSWSTILVPWLLKETEPKSDGRWWLTHTVEVRR